MTDNNKPKSEPQPERHEPRQDQTNLCGRYGCIGIEAVAAAARYSTPAREPAGIRKDTRLDERFLETAG